MFPIRHVTGTQLLPDNTFGEGFNWENAPWFDANGLQDVAKIEKESVVEKLQNN